MTDYPDPDILANLAHNVAALRAQCAVCLDACGLAWGDAAQEAAVRARLGGARSEVLLAADVLWVSSQHANLLHSLCALLARTPTARCLVVAGFHTGRLAAARFFDAAAAVGLVPDAAAAHGGLYERSVLGAERPWMGADDLGDISERARWVLVGCLCWADLVGRAGCGTPTC